VATSFTRREFLAAGTALGAGLALDPIVRRLPVLPSKPAKLSDIEHVVIMMQENRSFDHYFGTLRGVRGFGDKRGGSVFAQPDGKGGTIYPFHIDSAATGGGCTTDPDHTWRGQHQSVADGANNGWITAHLPANGANTPTSMGYFDERDIPYYHALAKSFTICDRYFCSAMGATDPNRSYAMTGTIDPDGKAGGPFLSFGAPDGPPQFSWTTMPEQLETRGVSWKIYSDPGSTYTDGDNTVLFFNQYRSNPTLAAKGLQPTYTDFEADAAAGNLPQVSWLISPVAILEHPVQSTPPRGEYSVSRVLAALTAKPAAWKKTVLIITFDENGGFFDHVAPPLAPRGTPGEFLITDPLPQAAEGIAGPIGLGPRVPTLLVSPFSRGGFVSSEVFDHTSTLRLLETRFGAEVPNLSKWRRDTCGDLTRALNFANPDLSVPKLPTPPPADPAMVGCSPRLDTYPATSGVPKQAGGRARRPSGLRRG
jgi:phospholipase C